MVPHCQHFRLHRHETRPMYLNNSSRRDKLAIKINLYVEICILERRKRLITATLFLLASSKLIAPLKSQSFKGEPVPGIRCFVMPLITTVSFLGNRLSQLIYVTNVPGPAQGECKSSKININASGRERATYLRTANRYFTGGPMSMANENVE